MKPMKSSVKVVLSGVSGFVYPIILLFLTGLFEFLLQFDYQSAWIFEILLGTAVPILFLILENRFISRHLALACNTAYFIAAAVVCVFVLPYLTSFYVGNYYRALNPRDVWFSGLQWVVYFITLCIQEGLHLIVRLVIAFARRMANEHAALRGEKEDEQERQEQQQQP